MWGVKPSDRWNWDELRENIKLHGVRNSLLVAPMPTASTSQVLNRFPFLITCCCRCIFCLVWLAVR